MGTTPLQKATDVYARYLKAVMSPNGTKSFDLITEIKKAIEQGIKEDRATYRAQFRARERSKNGS